MSARRIVITGGDPTGIGLEILAKSIHQLKASAPLVLFSTFGNLKNRRSDVSAAGGTLGDLAQASGFILVKESDDQALSAALSGDRSVIVDISETQTLYSGEPSAISGQLALKALDLGISYIKKHGCRGLVTMPLSKKHVSLNLTGFSGHTEYLADAFSSDVLMLMHGKQFSVVPITVHIPISNVPVQLERKLRDGKLKETLKTLLSWDEYRKKPWAICGLNPHAGEGGLLGTEEMDFMNDVVKEWNDAGLRVEGPLPSDGLFQPTVRSRYRLILCCYHDQGLIPFKAIEGSAGINCTVGLPFFRSSPDHGTAFDIAGMGVADPRSFQSALALSQEDRLWI